MSEMSQKQRAALELGRGLQREKTHCKHGHEFTFENTLVDRRGFRKCRKCRNASVRKAEKKTTLTLDKARAAIAALSEGRTFNSIIGRGGPNGNTYSPGTKICNAAALKGFMQSNPRLGARMQRMIIGNRNAAFRRSGDSQRIVAAPALMKNNGVDAYEAVIHATRDLPHQIKNEVQGDLILAIGEKKLRIADIPRRLREFVTARNRADRNSVFNPWGHLSLEKPLAEDGSLTLMDVIREDQRLWG